MKIQYDFCIFERLGLKHEKKIFFLVFSIYCFNISEKTRYFITRFVSLQYKNANQYKAKLIEKYTRKTLTFLKDFFKFFLEFFCCFLINI